MEKIAALILGLIAQGDAILGFSVVWQLSVAQSGVAQEAGTSALVVPNAYAQRPGPVRFDDPFIVGSSYELQVYDASQFTPLSQGGYITGLGFRGDEGRGGFDVRYSTVEIQLATFSKPINTLPVKYDPSNYRDAAVVYLHSDVRLSGQGSTSLSVPAPFEFRFTFDKPFLYNSSSGNLLVYLKLGLLLAGGASLDVDDSRLDPAHPAGYSVVGPGSPFYDPVPSPAVLVAQFTFSPVPEPSVEILGMLGLGLIAVCRECRGRFS